MVIYTQPMKFQGFDYAEEENLACKMSSFPEMTAYGESFNIVRVVAVNIAEGEKRFCTGDFLTLNLIAVLPLCTESVASCNFWWPHLLFLVWAFRCFQNRRLAFYKN